MTLVREYQPTFVLGDGVTKEFSYLFEEVSENFVKVVVKHSDDSTYTPVFSVDLDAHKVVFGDSEPAPLDTDVVCIYRETPDLQDTPFRTLQGYDAKALENILSKIVAMIQELKANGFSTQILQGTPWQLDLLHPDDDGASVVIDYNARILKKGLYFQIVSGNLQVSADGNSFISMPKSADITEFRCLETVLEDLTVIRKLQYKVNNVWYDAEHNAQATADEALDLAQTVQGDLSSHKLNHNNPHETSVANLTDTVITNPTLGHVLRFNGTKWVNTSTDVHVEWGEIEGDIADQADLKNALDAKADVADLSGKVNIDGTSIMTAPLKFMSGSVRGAVGPYFNGVGFWKLDSQGNLTQIASISDSQFIPTTTESIDLGNSTKKWKDLYLGGKAYVGTINNGYDISVPAYAGTMVVADSTGATAGQLLLLDNNLKPVWGETSTYLTYPAGWTTTGTTKAFCDDIAADSSAVVGKAYLGEVTISDLPSGLVNAEIEVKIMVGTTAVNKVILLTLTSGNVAPYQWQYTYWNGGSDTSGWIGFQPELPSQTGNSGKFLTTDGSDLSWATVDALPTQTGHAGEYLTTDGSSASWAAINAGSDYHPDLFDWKWADSLRNDVQWLRADTFSWQSGSVYQAAFNELFYDIQISTYWYGSGGPAYTKSRTPAVGDAVYLNSDLTTQIGTVEAYDDVNDEITVSGDTYSYMSNTYVTPTTETVAGYTVTVYTGHSGKKIVSAGDETNVANIYTATGVAWYYIIDIPNERFKLPRINPDVAKQGFGIIPVKGNGSALGLTGKSGGTTYDAILGGASVSGTGGYAGTLQNANGYNIGQSNSTRSLSGNIGVSTDATKSGIVADVDAQTTIFSGKKYLYFYVGNFTQTALENTAGLNAELFNDKVDIGHDVIEFQAPNAGNNYTWYRKYRDGWVEQGGCYSQNINTGDTAWSATLPVPMSDNNYTASVNINGGYSGNITIQCEGNTSAVVKGYGRSPSGAGSKKIMWRVEGMAA